MEAEDILKYLMYCVKKLDDNFEPIITPTKGDPTKKQHDVSFVVMENVKKGQIPRFKINVKDLENNE